MTQSPFTREKSFSYNPHMELAQVVEKVEEESLLQMLKLQKIDQSIQKATGTMGMLIEQFNSKLQEAKQNNQTTVEVTDLMQEGVDTFFEEVWPEMESRHGNILDSYVPPFDDRDLENLTTDEVERILSRLTLLTNLDASHLKENSFTYQHLIHQISQMTTTMTEFFILHKQLNTMVNNQKTR